MSLPLVITAGEPAGISPEIIARAWQHFCGQSTFFAVIGDADHLAARGNIPVQPITALHQTEAIFANALPILHHPYACKVSAAQADARNAPMLIAGIDLAIESCQQGQACGMVTAPIDKSILRKAGFAHQGHTDYLAYRDGQHRGQETPSVMMLAAEDFRCVPVTVHSALANAITELSAERICSTLNILCQALRQHWKIHNPRIAVGGLNPHAGEGGQMGQDEITLINPALARFRAGNPHIIIDGALPTDSMFTLPMRQKYDAFVAMTHDQALIPIKTTCFDNAVNITLGLSFVRTSPDHGTAYDLAGTDQASPRSMIAAIQQAWQMSRS